MTSLPKGLTWFDEFERLGYYLERSRSGHWKAYDPAGKLAATLGGSPSDSRSWLNDRAYLRRHQQRREDAARKVKPSTRPESLAQARTWEKTKGRYLAAGLCRKCAGQAAWAHQSGAGGWGLAHPPCSDCAEIVELFPYPTVMPEWRCLFRKRTQGSGP
jgi:hypothetical protein